MVSETKQSLLDQKRLQYLENMYREKINQEQQQATKNESKLTYVTKRRLMSANRTNGGNTYSNGLLKGGGVASYADQIASKYKDRLQSAHQAGANRNNRRGNQRGLSGLVQQYSEAPTDQYSKANRRRTAQPNQRHKMI